MLNVKKVIGKVLSSNSYVLFEDNQADCFLIDVGDADAILAELPNNIAVKGIFLTHAHFDHIAGINKIVGCFPNCLVYTSIYGADALKDARKNFSYYHGNSIVYQGDNVVILSEGEAVSLFTDVKLNVLATPGHCPSCITYFTNDYIFTGDSYIPRVEVVTKLPRGNKKEAEFSLEKILVLIENRKVYPGHNVENWVSWI